MCLTGRNMLRIPPPGNCLVFTQLRKYHKPTDKHLPGGFRVRATCFYKCLLMKRLRVNNATSGYLQFNKPSAVKLLYFLLYNTNQKLVFSGGMVQSAFGQFEKVEHQMLLSWFRFCGSKNPCVTQKRCRVAAFFLDGRIPHLFTFFQSLI